MKLATLFVLGALSTPAAADFRYAAGNDVFTDVDYPVDDDGFTNDIEIRFSRPHRGYQIGGRLFDRWVTEVPRSAGGRRDLLELVATIERIWAEDGREVTVEARGGPSLTGNLGGRWMQDRFHALCDCGARLDEGLQSRYDGDGGIGALIGSRVRTSIGVPIAQAYGVVDGQVVAGAGVTWIDAAAGGMLTARIADTVELSMHAEVAVMRYHANDEGLAMSGGYGIGWQSAYRIGVHVAWSRFRIEYEYRANEGGSGEPIGVIAFTVKQAGTPF